jgi:arylsulfatase A-like enzyme
MRFLLAAAAVFLFTISYGVAAQVDGSRPNIVFMLADDMGHADPGFNGGDKFLTPHIDRFASQGTRLTQFYTHAVCAPTRAAFLTGRWSFRTNSDWRSEDFGKPTYLKILGLTLAKNRTGEETRRIHAMDTNERTVAEALKEAGYFTALIGKWHLGEWFPEHLPMGQGFMYQYGHYGWGIDYTNYTIPHNAPARYAVYDWHRNQQPVYEQGYATDLFANETVRLISEQKKDKPFFIYVPFNAVHGPHESIPRYTDKYGKREAALKILDDAVGQIVGAIDQYGFNDNTVVIFGNDNGGLREPMNKPYRGTKNTNLEGGVRTPCIVRWPGKIKAGGTNDEMMHIVDFYNTFITLGGGKLEQERPVDGINMTDVIFEGESSPRSEVVYDVAGCVRLPAMRLGRYKLVGENLYDMVADPTEQKDIAKAKPQEVAKIKARLAELAKERPALGEMKTLMTPALPWVYGRDENKNAPQWVKDHLAPIRAAQPKEWAPGTTPWPQAPKDGKIIYTGDGR